MRIKEVLACTFFFFSSRRRHTRLTCDWSSDVCFPIYDPDRDRGDRAGERLAEAEAVEGAPRGDVGAGDRRAPRPAVGLEHVAVEPQRALAECLEVCDRAQRAADQTLDLD